MAASSGKVSMSSAKHSGYFGDDGSPVARLCTELQVRHQSFFATTPDMRLLLDEAAAEARELRGIVRQGLGPWERMTAGDGYSVSQELQMPEPLAHYDGYSMKRATTPRRLAGSSESHLPVQSHQYVQEPTSPFTQHAACSEPNWPRHSQQVQEPTSPLYWGLRSAEASACHRKSTVGVYAEIGQHHWDVSPLSDLHAAHDYNSRVGNTRGQWQSQQSHLPDARDLGQRPEAYQLAGDRCPVCQLRCNAGTCACTSGG